MLKAVDPPSSLLIVHLLAEPAAYGLVGTPS